MKKVYLGCLLTLLGVSSSFAQNVRDSFEIFFEFNKAIVREDSKKAIDSFLRVTTERRLMTRVIGHTCDIGTDDYNLALSERRAKAAEEYIRSTGEPAEKMELLFFGKAELKYDIKTMREKNRRVFFGYTLEDDDRDTLVKSGCAEAFYEKGMFAPQSKTREGVYSVKNINTAAAVKSENILMQEKGTNRKIYASAIMFISAKDKNGQDLKPVAGKSIKIKMPAVKSPVEADMKLYRGEMENGKVVWVNTGRSCAGFEKQGACEVFPFDWDQTGYCACAKPRLCEEDCSEDPFGGEKAPEATAADVRASAMKTLVKFPERVYPSDLASLNVTVTDDNKSKGYKGIFQEDLDLCGQLQNNVVTDEWFPTFFQDANKANRNIIVRAKDGSGNNVASDNSKTITVYVPKADVKDLKEPVLVPGTIHAKGFLRWDREKFTPKTCLGPVNCEYHVFEVPATGSYKLTEREEKTAPKKEEGAILKTRVLKNSTVFVGDKGTNYVYKAANANRKGKVRPKEYSIREFDNVGNMVVLVQHTDKKGRKRYQEARLSELKYKKKGKMYIMRKKHFKKVGDFKDIQLSKCK